jgi:pimeloyl-ACP methyl ester carboxylesterase
MTSRWLAMLLVIFFSACSAIPTGADRKKYADAVALEKGWAPFKVQSATFELIGFAPRQLSATETLWVYVEGDGLAWLDSSTASADPTPRDPVALRMALAHQGRNVVYLSRPCQYVDASRTPCSQPVWTDGRFSKKVIASVDEAITTLKNNFRAKKLVLVGYSGGGAVAGLVAARRSDVAAWVTVAGNLDHAAWTAFHRVRPLSASLNAADVADRLHAIPQVHFIGQSDRVIPPQLAQRWPVLFLGDDQRRLRVITHFDHACCWAEQWGRFQQDILSMLPMEIH